MQIIGYWAVGTGKYGHRKPGDLFVSKEIYDAGAIDYYKDYELIPSYIR